MRYAGIMENDISDGIEGISVSFWTQGCPLHCKNCQNHQTWDFNGGYELPEDYLERIDKDITNNGIMRNLSILGGEPLCDENIPLVESIVSHVRSKFPSIKIILWSGYKYEELLAKNNNLLHRILAQSDILIDGRYEESNRDITLQLRGSTNQRIIDLKKSIEENKVILYK